MDEKIWGLQLGFQYKIYEILKWSSRLIWKGVCVLGLALALTNIYLLNFTYDNNTVEMVSKTHLERRVLGLVLGLTNIHTLHFTHDNNANTVWYWQ